MRIQVAVCVCLAATLLGCGPGNSFNGKVDGQSLNVTEAVFYSAKDSSLGIGTVVILSDKPNVCATLRDNKPFKETTMMELVLLSKDGAGKYTTTAAGEYKTGNVGTLLQTDGTGQTSWAAFSKFDAKCENTVPLIKGSTESGSVTVTEINAKADGRIVGTFDLNFGASRENAKGSFNATFCDVPDSILTSPTKTCE